LPNKGYNYEFRLYLEGVLTPFKTAEIVCTPNGVEANINLFSNEKLYDIKPKTAVQIFYRDWINIGGQKRGWRLMFDGFHSSFFKMDGATEGRGVGIVCRDFRMDMRKAPAAMSFQGERELSPQVHYHTAGIFHTWVLKGFTDKANKNDQKKTNPKNAAQKQKTEITAQEKATKEEEFQDFNKKFTGQSSAANSNQPQEASKAPPMGPDLPPTPPQDKSALGNAQARINATRSGGGVVSRPGNPIRTYDTTGLQDLSQMLAMMAGSASGLGAIKQENGEYLYSHKYGKGMIVDPKTGTAEGGLFLDSIVRGMWTEAVGGTSICNFMNKRIRVDKRIIIPKNKSGFNFWSRQNCGLQAGSVLMGNSRFSSIEAVIMRVAGLFSVRVYSCSTPSLIPLNDDTKGWVIDEKVKSFLVDNPDFNFGAPYLLNETMLLPPLEFTSPPNCNLIFPCMYDQSQFQYDMDGEATRGYFDQIDALATPSNEDSLKSISFQVPNALFKLSEDSGTKKDRFRRNKPPLTLEERYKGVNVYNGSVEYTLGADDAVSIVNKSLFKKDVEDKIEKEIADLQSMVDDAGKGATVAESAGISSLDPKQLAELVEVLNRKKAALEKLILGRSGRVKDATNTALNRHALLKFLNTRYSGRVMSVNMCFNPYVMSGFPGAVIAEDEFTPGGSPRGLSMKTIVGMVQQVKHVIAISNDMGEASTTVVLSGVRFADEPTDMDDYGNPLYLKETDKISAEVKATDLSFVKSHFVDDPKPPMVKDLDDDWYDLDETIGFGEYIYAKDLLTLTAEDVAKGERNQIYLDENYEPNKISNFYKRVLRHKEDHFMINTHSDIRHKGGDMFFFAYDSIDEGLRSFNDYANRKSLLNDYEACMNFIHRDVCSADAFFHGILGLSSYDDSSRGYYVFNGDIKKADVNEKRLRPNGFDPSIIKEEYYGVSSKLYFSNDKNINGLKKSEMPGGKESGTGHMSGPGMMSSIREHMPITALIHERKEAVKKYVEVVKRKAQGVQFANK